jgi:hypothetical protein
VGAAALVAGALALAALTLLAPSSPSYDPFAWIVWGRQLAGEEPFGLAGGPSWKPLPVLFTAPFSLLGGSAPALWLLVARAGALLALAGAYRLGARVAGPLAGAVGAVALLLLADLVSLAWRGASEPLLLACLLWGIERHLAGRPQSALALGVAAALIRPEAVPFLALYVMAGWRAAGSRERATGVAGLALIPLLWLGIPALGGDPLAASATATSTAGETSPWTALRHGLELPPWPVWPLAVAALALRPRDRTMRLLAAGAVAWLALVVAMTAFGYPGVGRYMLPAAAVACVLAGVGVAALRAPLGAALFVSVVALSAGRLLSLDDQVEEGMRVGRLNDSLAAAVSAAGGPALRACALGGAVAVNHTAQSALAWELRVPLDRVARTLRRAGVVVRAPRSPAVGSPPPVALPEPVRRTPIARAGSWRVEAVGAAPPACRPMTVNLHR